MKAIGYELPNGDEVRNLKQLVTAVEVDRAAIEQHMNSKEVTSIEEAEELVKETHTGQIMTAPNDARNKKVKKIKVR